MICDIVFYHAPDSEHVKDDLLRQLKTVSVRSICIDDRKPRPHPPELPPPSKLQIVFFSPGFLSFLECRPEEAYAIFMHLDPQSTVALFCCGLREREVMCYHTAPLKSFNSWPKFEATREEDGRIEFSRYLLEIIQDVFPGGGSTAGEVVLVPQLVNKEFSRVYVIFPSAVENMSNISVYVDSSSYLQIIPESINPYVMQFRVPEVLLDSCREFQVRIQQSGIIILEKWIRVIPDDRFMGQISSEISISGKNSETITPFEQLHDMQDVDDTSYDDDRESRRTLVPPEEDVMHSLVDMCKRYGLEELSSFIDETQVPEYCTMNHCANNTARREFIFDEEGDARWPDTHAAEKNECDIIIPAYEEDEFTGRTRSSSLPAVMPPPDEVRSRNADYVNMGMRDIIGDPRLFVLASTEALSQSESCISNSTYVSMRCYRGKLQETVCKGLTKSQADLLDIMHAFKKGETTLQDVERCFQMWQEDHPGHFQHAPMKVDDDPGFPAPYFGMSKTADEKPSSVSDSTKRSSDSSGQSRRSSDIYRKSSNASASSLSSKTSDTGAPSPQSQQLRASSKSPHEVSTGWIPQYTTAKTCPLNPDSNPLQARPRPGSRLLNDPDESTKRRRRGTRLTPILADLQLAISPDSDKEDYEEGNATECLLQVCERYGLGHLSYYFFRELYPEMTDLKNVEELAGDRFSSKDREKMNQSCSQLHSPSAVEHESVSFQRSLSLPSTLFPTAPAEQRTTPENDDPVPENDVRNSGKKSALGDSTNQNCTDYVNSVTSNIYASVQAYMSLHARTENSKGKYTLSRSQQELLELMEAFKRGEKTISQVEHQFQEWHRRHTGASFKREQQLSQLRNEYERAQKSSAFAITKFIPWKPKKKRSKTSVSDNKPAKRKERKGDSDNKRLSKISYTSTSSGISENGEVNRNFCYFNPAYGETTQEFRKSNLSSSPYGSSTEAVAPPPLPARPPLTPVSVMRPRGGSRDEDGGIPEAETSSTTKSGYEIPISKKKPSPPPKPRNYLQKKGPKSDISPPTRWCLAHQLCSVIPDRQPTIDEYPVYQNAENYSSKFEQESLSKSEDGTTVKKQKPIPPPKPRIRFRKEMSLDTPIARCFCAPQKTPLTPLESFAELCISFSEDNSSEVTVTGRSPARSESDSPSTGKKQGPVPPPKPRDHYKKVCGSSPVEESHEWEDGFESRRESPIYIKPPPICSVPFPHNCAKVHLKTGVGSCHAVLSKSQAASSKKGKTTCSSTKARPNHENGSQPYQALMNAIAWNKSSKKAEKSMFYVTRRWSSSPNLSICESRQEPIYLELLNYNVDDKKRSISDSNAPRS